MIVESPAKAKTIEKFLGGDFTVKSCFGHIRDLAPGDKAIDKTANFSPTYVVPDDKTKIVKELKKLKKDAVQVWLATDEDREGEAISWHLCEVLGIDPREAKRIVFHEITKSAILKAVENPRNLDLSLVNAQQARRVLDRLVGFELSPVLWRKVRPKLSAGRVQSVAVRLIVERDKEIKGFEVNSSYKVTAFFQAPNGERSTIFKAQLPKNIASITDAESFLNSCVGAEYTVTKVEKKPATKKPAPPFITSTLQQEASRKLGFSVSKTMVLAQRLYESGKITYMRTDSVNLADSAIKAAAASIREKFGDEYVKTRKFTTKSAGAQEAHEAIRPTNFDNDSAGDEYDQERLYELIWKRAVASQMSEAQLEKTTAKIDISTNDAELTANGEVIKFDGFLKLYIESTDDEPDEKEDSKMLPPLAEGQKLDLQRMNAMQRFSRPPARYNEASLVRRLEELGIGRPSTYAPTITTIQKREYVVKQSKEGVERAYELLTLENETVSQQHLTEKTGVEKNKLFPTDTGILVNDFLVEYFKEVLDYGFTAQIEKQFDEIADGQKEWPAMITEFYDPFHTTVEKTLEIAERVTGERVLGTDPKSGRELLVRMGRYGAMAQIGRQDDEEKPVFAGLLKDQSIESITLEEAIDLFKLPRTVGEFEEKEVVAAIGRFGPYVRHDGKFVSIPKDLDPLAITLDQSIELILKKREADANKYIHVYEESDIQVLNGRYGPYIKQGRNNYKIPKGTEPKDLTEEACKEIIEKNPPTGRRKRKAK